MSVSLQQKPSHAVLEISDQGGGVEESELDSLFEPFFRSRATVDDKASKGSGLGLAIAKRAVQKNGGSIAASNIAGGGFRVTIKLPLADN